MTSRITYNFFTFLGFGSSSSASLFFLRAPWKYRLITCRQPLILIDDCEKRDGDEQFEALLEGLPRPPEGPCFHGWLQLLDLLLPFLLFHSLHPGIC